MAKKSKKQRHLTLTDRTYIEQELVRGSSFTDIGNTIGKDPSTISKEIKSHMEIRKASFDSHSCRNCQKYKTCTLKHLCGSTACNRKCKHCSILIRQQICNDNDPITCSIPFKPPYVCNSCPKRQCCHLEKHVYYAKKAQAEYETTLVNSRIGINMTPEELAELNSIISPLIMKGQPLSHIFAVHADDIPICRRTLYNYLDQGVFEARNIHLHRRVRYKKRRTNNNKP